MKKNGDTKKAMANALRACMQSSPIDRISIKEITDACGLNRQTFYYHFKDIYDLIKWMYVYDINEAIAETREGETTEEMLYRLLRAFDRDRDCHLAVYNSRNYYPNLRLEIIGSLSERLSPVFEPLFERNGFDEEYREFLRRMYALVIFEYIERRARGNAFSDDESFVQNWIRTIDSQFRGELLRMNRG